jgi:outer membrane biosynthesis protein TonB
MCKSRCFRSCHSQHYLAEWRAAIAALSLITFGRYIVKPAPLYVPATLEQLLSQEKAAAKQLTLPPKPQQDQQPEDQQKEQQQQQQQQHGSSKQDAEAQQKQEEQQEPQQHEQPQEAGDQQKQQQQKAEEEQQQKAEEEQQQQQQLQQWQQEQLSCTRSLQSMLTSPPRVVYGYSLAGRGLLQLLRGLPPYADWVRHCCCSVVQYVLLPAWFMLQRRHAVVQSCFMLAV